MKLKLKKENGQAMVEFALVLPILLLFVAGIIDFGWIFYNQLAANNASREAARFIAIHYYFNDMDSKADYAVGSAEEKALEIINSYTAMSDLLVDPITPESDDVNGGEKIKVKFKGNVIILTPLLSKVIDTDGDGKFLIKSECTMRVEK
ncbi:MAG: TadE family protein [Sedimentibacter sp.]|uniref:TadE/TadG family type IV pilus assembly protein n=1 Tax=Sedimentibacter sp. TaxID=1960295 RepID=UPI0031593432